MRVKYIVCFIISLVSTRLYSQQLFYSDIIYGGVTGGGFSVGGGSGTINSTLLIPPNSTIKKAFLITATDSTPPPITVILNGNNYTFNNSSIITNNFIAYQNGTTIRSNSSIRLIDITTDIDSSILNYSMFIPAQLSAINQAFYSHFYLYIVYTNINMNTIAVNLFLNKQDVAINTLYNLNNFNPINNNFPVGLELLVSHFCDTLQDGSYISVNGNQLGLLGGSDANSSLFFCTGVYANFAHYNDTLFGLDDDTPDSLMEGTDGLADIKSYVNNGDTSINITFTKQSNFGAYTNPIRAVMLSYSTPCDTFTTTITANDTICLGESVQLQATGGVGRFK